MIWSDISLIPFGLDCFIDHKYIVRKTQIIGYFFQYFITILHAYGRLLLFSRERNKIVMNHDVMGLIVKREDGSEIVNYDDASFPSYIIDGWVAPKVTWERVPHFHEDVEIVDGSLNITSTSDDGQLQSDPLQHGIGRRVCQVRDLHRAP